MTELFLKFKTFIGPLPSTYGSTFEYVSDWDIMLSHRVRNIDSKLSKLYCNYSPESSEVFSHISHKCTQSSKLNLHAIFVRPET